MNVGDQVRRSSEPDGDLGEVTGLGPGTTVTVKWPAGVRSIPHHKDLVVVKPAVAT